MKGQIMLKKIGSSVVALAPLSAFAAVPTDVTTAMSSMQADGIAVATVFLVASIAIIAFLFMRKGARA
jgi:hypothetical protein